MRKKTKNPAEVMRKLCVDLAKTIVKIIAGYVCAYCGRKKPDVAIHAHHIYNEGVHKSMSADIDNIISVCFTHHLGSWNTKEPSFHRNPQEMADWIREKYPERMKTLKQRARGTIQCDLYYWTNKLKELSAEKQKWDLLSVNKGSKIKEDF